MKFFKYLSIFTIVISIGGPIFILSSGNRTTKEKEMQDFIIGKWASLQIQNAPESETQYKLEFLDTGTLIYSIKAQNVEFYNIEYDYRFINKNRILVKNARAGEAEWDLIKEQEYLKIRMPNRHEYIVFQRSPHIMWGVLVVSLAILTIATLFSSPIITHSKIERDNIVIGTSTQASNKNRERAFAFLYRFVTIIFFGIGILIANKVDRWSLFLQIDEPLQPIIVFEVSLLMLIAGVRLVKMYWTITQTSKLLHNTLNRYFGVLLLGGGVYGILISLFDLAFSLAFKN